MITEEQQIFEQERALQADEWARYQEAYRQEQEWYAKKEQEENQLIAEQEADRQLRNQKEDEKIMLWLQEHGFLP